jgi:hypothetical protein
MQKRLPNEMPLRARQATVGNNFGGRMTINQPLNIEIPPTTELFPIIALVDRHKSLLTESKVRWAVRNRARNGLAAAGGVFEAKNGELLIREPVFLAWFLGLDGRNSPRAARR